MSGGGRWIGLVLLIAGSTPFSPLLRAAPLVAPSPAVPRSAAISGRMATGDSGGTAPRAADRGPEQSGYALLDAALAADPLATPASQRLWAEELRRRLAICRQQTGQQTSAERRAAAAFQFVQAQWLTGPYDSNCARLQRTLEDGTYNCLTATLLYLATCRDAGLIAVPLAAPGHVAVRVWWDATPHDVETTDRRWLPQPVEFGSVRGQQITDRALLGRVYYNLGIQLAREGDFARALQTTRQSCLLDPTHAEARANLLATLNNWSIQLARQGQYAQAEALIQEGLRLDDQYVPLHRSAAFVRDQQSTAAADAAPNSNGPRD